MIKTLPPVNSWVAQMAPGNGRPQIAKIKDAYLDPLSKKEVLLDLVFYQHDGTKMGRVSDAMGGPRGFEPACAGALWTCIQKPDFALLSERNFTWDDLLVSISNEEHGQMAALLVRMRASKAKLHEIALDGPEMDAAERAAQLGFVEFVGNGIIQLTECAEEGIQP